MTNYIGVAKVSSLIITGSSAKPDPKAVLIPFDNDIISMYQSRSLSSTTDNVLPMTSSYVAPLYDEVTRAGLVIGSLEHTTWKTGLKFHAKTFRLEDSQYGESVCNIYGTRPQHHEQLFSPLASLVANVTSISSQEYATWRPSQV